MDRRLASWLITVCGLFLFWMLLKQLFPAPNVEPKPVAEQSQVQPSQEGAEKPAEGAPKTGTEEAAATPPKTDSAETPTVAVDDSQAKVAPDARPYSKEALLSKQSEFVSLGSMDTKDGYQLLATFTTRGAGLVRAEAVEQTKPGKFKFKALDTKSAYIGYLALTPADAGLTIGFVGPGTPAASAQHKTGGTGTVSPGLQAGDIIKEVNTSEVRSLGDFDKIMQQTKAGVALGVTVERPSVGELGFECVTLEAPMDIVRLSNESAEEVVGNLTRTSCLTTLASIDGRPIESNSRYITGLEATLNGVWDHKSISREGFVGIEFSLPLAEQLKAIGITADITLVKRYWLPKPTGEGAVAGTRSGYVLDYEVEVINNDDKPHSVSLRQEGLNGITLESWWYAPKISPYFFQAAGARDVLLSTNKSGHRLATCYSIYDDARRNPTAPDRLLFGSTEPADQRTLKYIGVDGYYFTTAFVPTPGDPSSLANLYQAGTTLIGDPTRYVRHQEKAANTSFWIDTQTKTIEPQQNTKEQLQIFIGPKQPELLSQYGLSNTIEYGWFWWVARPLSWLLHFFYSIVRNYGIAIMLLTFLVRGSLFPLGRKAALNAQRMQELAPELKRISEQYKDDYEKRAKATQEFYAKNNFKPWAGCLPIFFQIPIFIGLYRCLSVDIELRQQALLPGVTSWCSNLAGPDMLWYWGSFMPNMIAGRGEGWFGPYFNILPCITVVLFIIQQKIMMPKATDEQTQMTQTMMMYMTVFMGLMFFKVPAGLCIYFITSSIWSLFERKLVKRLGPPPQPPAAPAPEPPPSRDARKEASEKKQQEANKKPGWFEKMKQIADQAGSDNSTTYRREKPKDKDQKKKK